MCCGLNAMQSCGNLWMFRRNLLLPSSGYKIQVTCFSITWKHSRKYTSKILCTFAAFSKLRKETIVFVMSAPLSVRLHGTIRLSLDGFLWNLSIFRKSAGKIQGPLKSVKNNGYCTHEDHHTFLIILVELFLEWEVFKSCRESQNTHFMFNNVFTKILLFMK